MKENEENPGDLQAYVKLMTEHQSSIRAFVVSLMPGSPDINDIVQETNAALWQKRGKFHLGSNFTAWAFRIARYEVHRQRDRNRRLGRIGFSEKMFYFLAETEGREASDDNIATALDSCLGKLTPSQREMIRARYTPGRSLEEHAESKGCSPGSLRIALLRIRETLKQCVENTLEGKTI
jgi:RNA polymerase sigma-70 factor (ECF subfamily)